MSALLQVQNVCRKCGVGSDMTLTVDTRKANQGGIPSALSAALTGAGVTTSRDRSRYRADRVSDGDLEFT